MIIKNNDAIKILRKLDKECPDCGEHALIITIMKKENDGVVYSEKIIYCLICEYSVPFKKKNEKRVEFEDN